MAIPQGLVLMLAVACGVDGPPDPSVGRLAMVGLNHALVPGAETGSRTSAKSSSCSAKNFPGVVQLERDCFETNAGLRGNVTWVGDNESGTFTYKRAAVRVKTAYTYSPTSLDLTLTILEKPWVATCKMLYGRYLDGLAQCS